MLHLATLTNQWTPCISATCRNYRIENSMQMQATASEQQELMQ